MNFIKKHVEISQLDLHFKNLYAQLDKTLVQNNQTNDKMYNYNFQRIVLKYIKLIIDFMEHLAIKQNHYQYFDKIKKISNILHQASKDHKARSSRTDDQSLQKFSKFTNSSQFLGPFASDKQIDDKKQMDQIQQFMMRRNFQMNSNLFGDVDEGFKNKQRNQLQEFLTHADIHAKNLQFQLKSSSNQRKKMSNSFKIGSLSKNKLLLKKTTFDLQRINQLTKGNYSNQLQSHTTIIQNAQSEQKSIQTIFTQQNIDWNKILTYCLKKTKIKKLKSQQQAQQQIGVQSQGKDQFDKQFNQIFDPQIFGQYNELHLIDCQIQTDFQDKQESKKITINASANQSNKKNSQKKTKTTVTKASVNQKRLKTKQKQSKANSVYIKNNQSQFVSPLQKSVIIMAQKNTQVVLNLQIDSGTINQYHISDSQKIPTHTTFQCPASPTSPKSKKSMKALQLKQLIFQFTSKKQLDKKAQVGRNQRKQKSINGLNMHRSFTDNNQNNNKSNTQNLSKDKSQKYDDQQEQKSYQTTINIQQGLVRRKLQKKNTWKGSNASSNSILKSTARLNQLKTDQNMYLQNQTPKYLNTKIDKNVIDCQGQQQKPQNLAKIKKQRRTSNFKQMYGIGNTIQSQKIKFNKRNTLDNLIGYNLGNKQLGFFNLENDQKDIILKNRIQQQEFQASYRNTQEKIVTNAIIHVKQKKNLLTKNDESSLNNSNQILKPNMQIQQKKTPNQNNVVKHKAQIRIHHTQIKNQKKITHEGNTLRTKTVQRQENTRNHGISKRNNIQRNSTTVYQFQNSTNVYGKNRKKHVKYASQDLPQLSQSKQKLSDIKKILGKQSIAKNGSPQFLLNKLLKKQQSCYNGQKIKKTYINDQLQTPQYRRIMPIGKQNKNVRNQMSIEQQQSMMKGLRKLFMTKSYRDKLLLYLSMIQVTHEKYCGKNCQHIQKFINDLTGDGINCSQSVAQQLLRLYNKKGNHITGNINKFVF